MTSPLLFFKIASFILIAGRKEDALTKYPHLKEAIEYFSQKDPTINKNLKYLDWELKILSSHQALKEEIADVIILFDKYKENLKHHDINYYTPNKFGELRDELFSIKEQREHKDKKVEQRYRTPEQCQSTIVYEDDDLIVRHIQNKSASIHYGLGTKWCITQKSATYYEDYDANNVVFFFIIRKEPQGNAFDKVAIAYQRDQDNNISQTDYFDINDHQINESKLKQNYGNAFNNILNITKSIAKQQPKSLIAKITSNEATSEEIIKAYEWAMKQEDIVKNKILVIITTNKNIPSEILRELSNDQDTSVRRAVARNVNTPPEILRALSKDQNADVRFDVAGNVNTPPEILRALSNDQDAYVRFDVAGNVNTTPEILRELSNDQNTSVRRAVARNVNTPPEILRALSNDQDAYVRVYVVGNVNTPPEILRALSNDQDAYVRFDVAGNVNTTPEILRELSNDQNTSVRRAVARNVNTPPEILRALSKDQNADVRRDVAGNVNTTPEILRELSNDQDADVRRAVARNVNTTPEILRELSNDQDADVRRAVARNVNTPPEILRALSKDQNADVQHVALINLQNRQ